MLGGNMAMGRLFRTHFQSFPSLLAQERRLQNHVLISIHLKNEKNSDVGNPKSKLAVFAKLNH